jgi:hypothetical protein
MSLGVVVSGGVTPSTIDNAVIGGATPAAGTFTAGAFTSLNFGSAVAPGGVTDLSRQIALYSTTHGFSITTARLNYVVPSANSHAFVVNGADIVSIGSSGLGVVGNVGFYNTAPIAKQTGVAVTAAAIHAALTALGLIAP